MRKIIVLLAIIVLIVACASYGTIAYFTVQKKTTNIITSGNIDMILHDETSEEEPFPPDGLSGIMPGDSLDKIVYIENIGDHDFYTRIKLANSILPDKDGIKLNFNKIHLNIDTANWQLYTDGWYYYLSSVEEGKKTAPLFTKVTFDNGMGNEYTNANVKIEVFAQAVQCANNGDTIWQAQGWPVE